MILKGGCGLVSIKWLRTMRYEVQIPAETHYGDFLPYVVALVGGGRYPVELVEVCASWPGHYSYQKKITKKND